MIWLNRFLAKQPAFGQQHGVDAFREHNGFPPAPATQVPGVPSEQVAVEGCPKGREKKLDWDSAHKKGQVRRKAAQDSLLARASIATLSRLMLTNNYNISWQLLGTRWTRPELLGGFKRRVSGGTALKSRVVALWIRAETNSRMHVPCPGRSLQPGHRQRGSEGK
jgi:hypothetical protein